MSEFTLSSPCFWCPDIGDAKVVTYSPCPQCLSLFSEGYTIFEYKKTPVFEEQGSYYSNRTVYPTGRYVTLTTKGAAFVLREQDARKLLRRGFLFFSEEKYAPFLSTAHAQNPVSLH